MRRVRGRFFCHVADVYTLTNSDDQAHASDGAFKLLLAGQICCIVPATRSDSVTLLGRVGQDAATLYFPSGTPVTENCMVIDQTAGPNNGNCWQITGDPIDEPAERRGGPNMLTAVAIKAAPPPYDDTDTSQEIF